MRLAKAIWAEVPTTISTYIYKPYTLSKENYTEIYLQEVELRKVCEYGPYSMKNSAIFLDFRDSF